ncbi:hypothetical protein RB653_003844 [Dictyostelium firmibasis]|uniref:Uncharacterized protein n=1 Tax=Dictyostelium firmibasis TaxID=79012 RepID=A0AAN7YXG6_9MYCE
MCEILLLLLFAFNIGGTEENGAIIQISNTSKYISIIINIVITIIITTIQNR